MTLTLGTRVLLPTFVSQWKKTMTGQFLNCITADFLSCRVKIYFLLVKF